MINALKQIKRLLINKSEEVWSGAVADWTVLSNIHHRDTNSNLAIDRKYILFSLCVYLNLNL
jgi:hypothetical protein